MPIYFIIHLFIYFIYLFYYLFNFIYSFSAKISDVMTFSGTAAVPESWSVYRMIHFLDSKGFSVEPKTQLVIADKAYQLLWAWHFIMLLMPKVQSYFRHKLRGGLSPNRMEPR